ncbi:SGNH/GDSL hydrolase family protein [Nocardioides ferulae]|uniref:SGNH/GDSL hydrolase family protein n=1 Tax=Nocardioides ferulae TaxID=2340821 RepID=UPI000EB51979|nr:SGNH/GDSL hydrolase family protein [Nocardioides ferulae]
MTLRGVAGLNPLHSPRTRARLVPVVCAALLVAVLTLYLGDRAIGDRPGRCERFTADAAARAAAVTGSGRDVLVIGDSYSAGLGLVDASSSWPVELPGRVHVAGFSGSGFSARASGCGPVSFADRAPDALAGVPGSADLVVVEGGLNDYDQSDAEIRAGFARLAGALAGRSVVVVGPVPAPARAAAVPRVDALLAGLAARHRLAYVSAAGLELTYLDDRLHLTPEGHRAFGAYVAAQVAELGL